MVKGSGFLWPPAMLSSSSSSSLSMLIPCRSFIITPRAPLLLLFLLPLLMPNGPPFSASSASSPFSAALFPSGNHRSNANNAKWHADGRRGLHFDDALLQAWHEFVVLQANQSAIADRDHPVDERIFNALRKCGGGVPSASTVPNATTTPSFDVDYEEDIMDDGTEEDATALLLMRSASSASTLAPQWVEIYAEIGQLVQFCANQQLVEWLVSTRTTTIDMMQVAEEFRHNCSSWRRPSPTTSTPGIGTPYNSNSNWWTTTALSLGQIFASMGARVQTLSGMEHIAGGSAALAGGGLVECTRRTVNKIRTDVHAQSAKWKVLVIAPGLHDIPYGQNAAILAQDVLQSVQLIKHGLPRRTFLLIIRQSSLAFWRSVAKMAAFCAKMLSLWELDKVDEDERAWDLLEARLRAVYGDDEEFHVQLVDLLERARPVITAQNYADLSPLAADCAHLSPRGVSLLSLHLWNWLVQPRLRHSQPFVPLLRPPLCPRPHCPFLTTPRNIVSCPRLPPSIMAPVHDNQIASAASLLRRLSSIQLSTVGKFLFLFLLLLLLGVICAAATAHRRRRRYRCPFPPPLFPLSQQQYSPINEGDKMARGGDPTYQRWRWDSEQ